MGSIAGDDVGVGKEERILVSVRIRPLNAKEIERNDASDWECINSNTVIFKNSLPDRAMYPTAYTFDRVFGCDNTTKQVYEEGAKEVALSVVSGINSSIFAYGQTSSGKTYTMTGITGYSVSEIYDYIEKHPEREFVLRFSAMEIYNESVKDLLNPDTGPLRLLDDPEKGTIVEKLTEETLRDQDHLKQLLSFCEAQRQIGETSLNEMSSRSHQILRLSIESSAREFVGKSNFSTLAASVNFVDLAGSERASQALTAGSRLKEGCHINRSLLTLGTVIRKLSKGRNGQHVPYRDSKLTRILQSSLGGNARTAIICTMSPARSHMEQSRNTLQFAICAKDVVTSAQVNVVMTDKALVKHLQKELSRLENELKYMGPTSMTCPSDVLKEKEAQIKKMESEMKELMKQRDLAQSRLEDLLRAVGDDQASGQWEELSQSSMSHAPISYEDTQSETSGVSYQTPEFSITRIFRKSEVKNTNSPLYHSASTPTFMRHQKISPLASPDFEDNCKEVCCIEMIEPGLNKIEDFDLLNEDIDSLLPPSPSAHAKESFDHEPETKGETKMSFDHVPKIKGETIMSFDHEPKTQGERIMSFHHEPKTKGEAILKNELTPLPSTRGFSNSKRPQLVRSRSCRASLSTGASSLWFEEVDETNNTPPPENFLIDLPKKHGESEKKIAVIRYGTEQKKHSRDGSENFEESDSSDAIKPQNTKMWHDGTITRVSKSVDGLNEMAQIHYQKEHKFSDNQEVEYTADNDSGIKITIKDVCLDPVLKSSDSTSRWKLEFEKKQQEIVEFWHECNVSLIHRSFFFLLIKGDPADSIYMEVEHRRLSFLRNSSSQGSLDKNTAEESTSHVLSVKNLRREREKLCRLMRRLPVAERENLYAKWGIALDSKQRRQQLSRRVWTETKNMEHVRESTMLVAKLFGFLEPAGSVPKEMFGLSFTPQLTHRGSFSWKNGVSSRR